MDWDKLKVFHAAAEVGSFTHAGERLGRSQSAISRQVSALEQELSVPLFHRHARGLILTEHGEMLYNTAQEILVKLESARAKLTDSRDQPNGSIKVTTTIGIGAHWLIPRLVEFNELYPDIRINLISTDEELDLAMREADVAIRLRQPTQWISSSASCSLFTTTPTHHRTISDATARRKRWMISTTMN